MSCSSSPSPCPSVAAGALLPGSGIDGSGMPNSVGAARRAKPAVVFVDSGGGVSIEAKSGAGVGAGVSVPVMDSSSLMSSVASSEASTVTSCEESTTSSSDRSSDRSSTSSSELSGCPVAASPVGGFVVMPGESFPGQSGVSIRNSSTQAYTQPFDRGSRGLYGAAP